MEPKQGKVVLNGKEFICTYGESLDGKRYYFVAGGELPNGNRIATSDVSEALNQTGGVIRTLGLINKNGDVLVPLIHKTVNTIDAKYIVFEKTIPASDEILDMREIKADPLKAAKFAEDTIHIKQRMQEVAGPNAVDVYMNPEGSASVYTFDGESVVEGKYYNYIIKGRKGFAFATSRSQEIKSVGDEMNAQEQIVPEQPTTPVVSEASSTEQVPIVPQVETQPEGNQVVEQTPTEAPQEEVKEKSPKDKVLDEAAEVIRKQNSKIKTLTNIIKEQSNIIEEKNKYTETLNKTIDDQSNLISTLENDKRELEVETAKIDAGITNLKGIVKDAIEVLDANDIEETYTIKEK